MAKRRTLLTHRITTNLPQTTDPKLSIFYFLNLYRQSETVTSDSTDLKLSIFSFLLSDRRSESITFAVLQIADLTLSIFLHPYFRSPIWTYHQPIANPPHSAQLGGTLYHSPKLHLDTCSSSVSMRRGTVRHTGATYIHFAWLCVM